MSRARYSPPTPWLFIPLLIAVSASASESPVRPNAELGKRIYREGVLPSGEPVRARVQGDIVAEGATFSCATCHRRSGLGSGEGGAYVLPVTARYLFQARDPDRADLFRSLYQEVQTETVHSRLRDPRVRPAYTDATLSDAIREGRDPSGRALDALMPRYELGDEDIGHLIAYLRQLGIRPPPGVDERRIHFATVVTEGVEPAKSAAMLDVMEAYLARKNANTRAQLERSGFSLWYKDDLARSFREWVLHVWVLLGPPDAWGEQLKRYSSEQPVFAVLSGIGREEWSPVHDFCEREAVPCLFPNTDPPVVEEGLYSFYLSRGLSGEAEALARYIGDRVGSQRGPGVFQIYRDAGRSRRAADAFRRALRARGIGLQELKLGNVEVEPASWRHLVQGAKPPVLVLWLERADMQESPVPKSVLESAHEIYLSYRLIEGRPPPLPESVASEVGLTYPFTLPGLEVPRIYRLRAWLRSRGVERRHERIQLNTYFALSVADHALVHLFDHFSREYFIESVEHETENALNPGVYPRLSLGPGQRFASKGSYIVRLAADGGIAEVSDWIVP